MRYQHVDPEEAVRIHMDVQTKKSVAIHWGTFALANEVSLLARSEASGTCHRRAQASLSPAVFSEAARGFGPCTVITVPACVRLVRRPG